MGGEVARVGIQKFAIKKTGGGAKGLRASTTATYTVPTAATLIGCMWGQQRAQPVGPTEGQAAPTTASANHHLNAAYTVLDWTAGLSVFGLCPATGGSGARSSPPPPFPCCLPRCAAPAPAAPRRPPILWTWAKAHRLTPPFQVAPPDPLPHHRPPPPSPSRP